MKIKYFSLQTFTDERGDLTPIEFSEHLPFKPERIYFLSNVTGVRGGHAHKQEQEVFVCISGSFTAMAHDGSAWQTFEMKKSDGLYTSALVWHEFKNFSADAIMLAISSTPYQGKEGYIMDFDEFRKIAST